MAQDLILEHVGRYINLSPDEEALFLSLLKPIELKRKELWLQQGDICKYSAFILTGVLRGFTIDTNGFEHVLSFAPIGWWMADMYSLISKKPGTLNIEAIEKTNVLLLSKTNQELLYKQVPAFERFFRIITENSLVAYQQRLMDNLSLSAEDRYNNFCKRYPTLINTLPKKDIATYIGVTPEFLSRMVGKLLKK